MPENIPTASIPIPIPIAAQPVQECADLSPELSSTPFSSTTVLGRFEYPFPITDPLLSLSPALLHAISPSNQALTDGSIVPPSGTGRGMDMSSFASFSPHVPTLAHLPYPSATASASQILESDQAQVDDALPNPMTSPGACVYDHHRYSAGQLCLLASAHSPMPPSLTLKRRAWQLSEERLERKGRTNNENGPDPKIGVSML